MIKDNSPTEATKAYRAQLLICAGTGCVSNRSFKVRDALEEEIQKRGLSEEVQVITTGCQGFCAQGPIMIFQPDGIFYQMLSEEDVPLLVEEHLIKDAVRLKDHDWPLGAKALTAGGDHLHFFGETALLDFLFQGITDFE